MIRYCLFFISLFINFSPIYCKPASDQDTNVQFKKNRKLIVLPAILKSPETKLGLGGAFSVFFKTEKNDTTIRTSNVEGLGLYTLNKQLVNVVSTNIYFPREKYIFKSTYSFSHFPDKFWGLGDYSSASQKEKYTYEQFLLYQQLQRKIFKSFYTGILYEFQNVYYFEYEKNGIFDKEDVRGRYGSKVSGLGMMLAWDRRNNAFSSTKGSFIQFTITSFNKFLGSQFLFSTVNFDVRKYFKTIYNQVIAFQLYANFNKGDTPIRNLSALGGSNIMRGYYMGRYRDKNLIAFQSEYRVPVWKRIGAVVFGGFGEVSPDIKSFSIYGLKYSVGGGLRFALKEKERLNIRIDYGFGYHSKGAYLIVSEAF
jgi:hypothetical protein